MMSAQKSHHIPVFDHVFGSFYLVISAFIALYLILGFSCISGEKGSIWKMCGDLKKEIGGVLSLNIAMLGRPNVATLRLYDAQPTSANVTTFQRRDVVMPRDSLNENFLDIYIYIYIYI